MEDFSKYNGEGTTLRKVQLRILDILVEVDKICRKHQIAYWLDFGTLLGAVRHGGFIPWDDDVDIAVRCEDMEKLRSVLCEELPSHLFYQDVQSDPQYYWPFSKVRDAKSLYLEAGESNHYDKPHGLYIDIFPQEFCFSSRLKVLLDKVYGRCYRARRNSPFYTKRDVVISHLIWPFISCLVALFRLFSKVFGAKRRMHVFGSFLLKKSFEEKDIFPLSEISFEGHSFYVPNNYDHYLRTLYGNYMELPPENQRRVHLAEIKFYD